MGPTNVNFLRKRYETLRTLPMFDTIEYTRHGNNEKMDAINDGKS